METCTPKRAPPLRTRTHDQQVDSSTISRPGKITCMFMHVKLQTCEINVKGGHQVKAVSTKGEPDLPGDQGQTQWEVVLIVCALDMMSWKCHFALCSRHVSSFHKLDAVTSALHACANTASSGQPIVCPSHLTLASCLPCRPTLPKPPTPQGKSSFQGCAFKTQIGQSRVHTPTTSLVGLSHPWPLSTGPNHPRAWYQATRY